MNPKKKKITLILSILAALIISGFLFLKFFVILDPGPHTKTGIILQHPIYEDAWGLGIVPTFGRDYILSFSDLPDEFKQSGTKVQVTFYLSNEDYDDTPCWENSISIVENEISLLEQ